MKTGAVLCLGAAGFHRMHYYDWGDPANPRVLLCVHGLTRNGRDFDHLARALSSDFRVICPDVVGRGTSEWLRAKDGYGYAQYMADMMVLIARVSDGAERQIHWLGTSMGGLLGILVASLPGNPIRKLVVNDAGMLVPKAALARLALYVGREPRFASLDALEKHLRSDCAPFGPLTDAQWRHLAEHSAMRDADGTWCFRYDPAIAEALRGPLADVDLSAAWDAVKCPTLVLRGSESDILLRATADEMTRRGPKAKLVEFDGIGHAPMLMEDAQVRAVREFLLEP